MLRDAYLAPEKSAACDPDSARDGRRIRDDVGMISRFGEHGDPAGTGTNVTAPSLPSIA